MRRAILVYCATTCSLFGYLARNLSGPTLHRTDYASVQFLANQNIAGGITNADGKVWITADSSPIAAINGALATWNGVSTSTARFAPLQTTTLLNNSSDQKHVIAFNDTADVRSLTSGALAVTVTSYSTNDGTITDTDILFNPTTQFSTNLASGTYDLQAVLTHELGHSLGANHTNILSATMFQSTSSQDPHQQTLGADDQAFVTWLYPAGGGNGYGTLSGSATVSGVPLHGGLITAVDPATGITVGGMTSLSDGTFSIQAPEGNYIVYVEPIGKLVQAGNLYLDANAVVDTAFQPTFAGSASQPQLIPVRAGATSPVTLAATAGNSAITAPYSAIGTAGSGGEPLVFTRGGRSVSSGQAADLLISGAGFDPIVASNIQIYGPASIRPGSVRVDPTITVAGSPVYRVTLDIPPLSTASSATVVLQNGSDVLTLSGLIALGRPQAVNAASYSGGPVAPGEILSFFGSSLGPTDPMSNTGFDATGVLPASLGNVTVTFDKTPAPLFYVSNNQLNLQVPYEVAGQTSTLMTVSYNGAAVAKETLAVASSSPGIFVVTNADGSVNGPLAPSPAGGILVVFGTGSGVTSVAAQTGAPSPAGSIIPASVTIQGQTVNPVYSGLTAGSVGLMQVNVAIPPGTPKGDGIPLRFSINGSATQTVGISVK